jgi:hypothetical protein
MDSDENPYFNASVASSSAAGAGRQNSLTVTDSRPQTRSRTPSPNPTITPAGEQPPPSLARTVLFRPLGDRQQSSIRLRRLSNPQVETFPDAGDSAQQAQEQQPADNGLLRPLSRFRSGNRSRAGSTALPLSRLPTIEDGVAQDFASDPQPAQVAVRTRDGNVAPGVVAQGQNRPRVVPVNSKLNRAEYDSNIVDFLDVIGECSDLHQHLT